MGLHVPLIQRFFRTLANDAAHHEIVFSLLPSNNRRPHENNLCNGVFSFSDDNVTIWPQPTKRCTRGLFWFCACNVMGLAWHCMHRRSAVECITTIHIFVGREYGIILILEGNWLASLDKWNRHWIGSSSREQAQDVRPVRPGGAERQQRRPGQRGHARHQRPARRVPCREEPGTPSPPPPPSCKLPLCIFSSMQQGGPGGRGDGLGWLWLECFTLLPSCTANSAKLPSAQEQPGRKWKVNQTQSTTTRPTLYTAVAFDYLQCSVTLSASLLEITDIYFMLNNWWLMWQ